LLHGGAPALEEVVHSVAASQSCIAPPSRGLALPSSDRCGAGVATVNPGGARLRSVGVDLEAFLLITLPLAVSARTKAVKSGGLSFSGRPPSSAKRRWVSASSSQALIGIQPWVRTCCGSGCGAEDAEPRVHLGVASCGRVS
jgi:hypothetical protein